MVKDTTLYDRLGISPPSNQDEIKNKSNYLLSTSLSLSKDPKSYLFDASKELYFKDKENLTIANVINHNLK